MNKIEQYIQDIIHREIQVKMDFHEPDLYEDSESFKEDGFIELPDDNHISYKFEWSYTRTKGMKGDGYLTPDDPDELKLDYLDITELSFYDGETGDETDLIKYPKLELLFFKYLIDVLPVDDVSSNIHRDIKRKEDGLREKRLYNFDNFVMNEKKKSKSKKKVTGKVKWHGGTFLIHDGKGNSHIN